MNQQHGSLSGFLTKSSASRPGDDPIFALNAEARRRKAAGVDVLNATLGALTDDESRLCLLPTLVDALARVPDRARCGYAPISGDPIFLEGVTRDLFGDRARESVAVATPGGSGALHLAITCLLDPGQSLLVPNFYWGPYATMAEHTRREIALFEMFDAGGRFHLGAFQRGLEQQIARQGRSLIIFNFPCNNPTGYSLDDDEWAAAFEIVAKAGRRAPVALLIDHAYARFATRQDDRWSRHVEQLTESALLLVAWTASKSFAFYGGRVGALVATHPDRRCLEELQNGLGFACRATWSNCNHAGLLAVGELLTNPDLHSQVQDERAALISLLDERVRRFNTDAHRAGLRYPRYEGGFFVSVFCKNPEAAAARMREDDVFVVPIRGAVRVALCSTPAASIPRLVRSLEKATPGG